jgi:hypothetical protein
MSNIITVKIDVTLLDKGRLFTGKQQQNGHVPKYADLVLIPRREVGQYGDTHIVKQSVTKAEREAQVELPIIGNATERGGNAPAAPKAQHAKPAPADDGFGDDSDVPF